MKREEINILKEVLAVQTSSYKTKQMREFIKKAVADVKGAHCVEDKYGNIYVTKGEAENYLCVVAHTDTVHDVLPKHAFHIYELKNVLFSVDNRTYKRVGIGGDDKVGVYIALRFLRELDAVKCAFFVDEEVGCKGSRMNDAAFFEDVNVAFQADRQNVREITATIMGTEMYGEEFLDDIIDILVAHNFQEVSGGMTDVWQLAEDHTKIPMFNVACGYYDPHTNNEYVNVVDVEDTYKFLMEVHLATKGKVYSGNWERADYGYSGYGWDYYGFGKSKQSKAGYKKSNGKKKDFRSTLVDQGWVWDDHKGMWKVKKEDELEDVKKCPHCFSTDIVDGAFEGEKWCNDCGAYLPEY